MSAVLQAMPAIGTRFEGRRFQLTLPRILAFSAGNFGEAGWPHRNLHTDSEIARNAGLQDLIASGTQFEGLLLSHLVSLFGRSWHETGELEAKLVKSCYADDIVTPVAVVTAAEKEGRGTKFALDVWCEKQTGEKVLVGSASAVLPEGPS